MSMRLVPIPRTGLPQLGQGSITNQLQQYIAGNQAYYTAIGFKEPWIAYVAIEDDAAVGTCAFKGRPKGGMVEIAYATLTEFEGRGVATRMAAELVRVARSTDTSLRIIAQTLPEENASARVLAKNGFAQVREAMDDEVGRVWEWELMPA